MTLRLLIAEDSRDVAEIIAFGAQMMWHDCHVLVASDGAQAISIFEQEDPDLIVLDISMPRMDGFQVCRRIRETSRVPILVLTVRDSMLDKVRALDLGADDYLTKPFDHLELFARLRALVRRSNPSLAGSRQKLTVGDLTLDPGTHEVQVGEGLIRLTSTEYHLLEELVRQPGSVLSHQFLLEQVWGPGYVDAHYLKVFVGRLRQKLGDHAENPRYIQTEWGMGYRFVANLAS